ncbi:MAG: hypothetical protein NC132_06470 [Corallococcus sp.]|nr:hypothetical protein [Corallococcus sp.]MCM1395728.1 hypothetical protein [Corallococcus sp.]
MAIKEKEVALSVNEIGNKDIVSAMEEYFGSPATPIDEFESEEAKEQYVIVLTEE